MICAWCRTAADMATGHDGTPIEAGPGLTVAIEAQKDLHGECTGCDCQHRMLPIEPRPAADGWLEEGFRR